ncbi:MAG: TolA-binding protein, partial [Candidatus Promineifilaceae bacterium]
QWSRRAHLGLGWALENKKQYIDALVAYAMVLKTKTIDETAARAQFQIGECHFAMKDYDMALKALLAVEVKYPFPEWVSKAMLEMGRTLEQKGDNVLAIDQYELLLQKYPDSDVASLATKRIAELSK